MSWRILLPWTRVEVRSLLDSPVQVERWSRPKGANRYDAGATFGTNSSQFVRVAFPCQPAGHESSHCEATYWRAACQWPDKQGGRRKKKKGFPLQSREPQHEIPQLPRPLKPNTHTQKKAGHVWKLLSFVHVSHGITEFWSHPVGHFEGIFFSPPSQSNLNNFQLHILTLNLSLMSYLCDYVSLHAKKKQPICTDCQPLVALSSFFLSSLRTVGTVFNFEKGGDQSKLPHATLQVNTKWTRWRNFQTLSKCVLLEPSLSREASRTPPPPPPLVFKRVRNFFFYFRAWAAILTWAIKAETNRQGCRKPATAAAPPLIIDWPLARRQKTFIILLPVVICICLTFIIYCW